ncbi:MAG: SDR family NAD(P)-dependent oxidoreductase [Frankiaceae bacterium]|nr:SDR family NAD(P)-dependent oxidoreductase [Frankiaceae bacterium]MBV9869465.1 SDR family NAD(P)-dependent oxidoreductase [Frankiaceae bacterium]
MATKTALVTGASSGIGEATALRLKELGFTVYGAARRVERMTALADAGVKVLKMDVTDDASMVAGSEQIVAETGRIDVLVNNAGYGSYGALEDVPMDEAKYQFEVNIFGLARLTQLVLPHMRAQGDGYIVNVSSVGGKIWEPLGAWYHATKYAVEGLSNSLRVEVKPFGIKVVVIEPGAIATEWSAIAADGLVKTSGHTAYAEQARDSAAILNFTDGNPRLASPPSVVAKAIGRAVSRRRPRVRYAVGGGAKPVLLLLAVLPDRGFDAAVSWAFRFVGKRFGKDLPAPSAAD